MAHPKYLCIHGHFYQPPREQPWLGRVEEQPSAAPFHDWNERVSAECYGPNSAARILDDQGRIRRLINNYEHISFNLGPTLLEWMERASPTLYEAILTADRRSRDRRGGCGNAVAQVYNHVIMPLASAHDRRTQVRWGIEDFVGRFGRRPEGMWLAETAVDMASLEALAEEGVRFTILAPHQAEAVRPLDGGGDWQDVNGGGVDPTRPYLCRLSNGREIVLFFYDGPISRAVAFEGALRSGAELLERIRSGFSDAREWPQLLTIGVDGETFGHHCRFGEMALAWVLDRLEEDPSIIVTNPAEYLSRHSPEWEVRIAENTSWSCAHGVERWRADCGCSTGDGPDFSQDWRAPLRAALEDLKGRLDDVFEGSGLFNDPWKARDEYLPVIRVGQSAEGQREAFLNAHLAVAATPENRVRFFKALEMQRCGLLMFTSCAWFFDEVSRIEARQVLAYAARAVQLALEFDRNLEPRFLDFLELTPSNVPEYGTAAEVYRRHVRPLVVELDRVVAHAALEALALRPDHPPAIPGYRIDVADLQTTRNAGAGVAVGRVTVRSELTEESRAVSYCAVHFGRHDFHCAVRGLVDIAQFEEARERIREDFRSRSVTELVRTVDRYFGLHYYGLRDLFEEERKRVLYRVSAASLRRAERSFRQVYEENRRLMTVAQETGVPVLEGFRHATAFVLSVDVPRALRAPLDAEFVPRLRELAEEARLWDAELDREFVAWRMSERIAEAMAALAEKPTGREEARIVEELLELCEEFGVRPDLWRAQNVFAEMRSRLASAEETESAVVARRLNNLGTRFGF